MTTPMVASPRRLLVVEDDSSFREVLVEFLSMSGYEVVFAEDGVEGLEKTAQGRYELVIADAIMPRMGGTELCEELSRRPGSPPVLLISGDTRVREIATQVGARHFLRKPIDLVQLLALIESWLPPPPAATDD